MSQPTMAQIKAQLERPKISKLFKMAENYGVVKRGFTAIDYLRNAIESNGWECNSITGIKGSAKSNLLMQRGHAIYGDWQTVHNHIITKPEDFEKILGELDDSEDEKIPWIGADDLGNWFPKNLYHTKRKVYTKLAENWELMRTVLNCFDFTATRKNKVATFFIEDLTGDIRCFNREKDIKGHYDYQRWMWLRDLKDPTNEVAKSIFIEKIPFPLVPDMWKIDKEMKDGVFIVGGVEYSGEEFFTERSGYYGVPRGEFRNYWERRLELGRKGRKEFQRIIREYYIPKPPLTITEQKIREAGQILAEARKAKARHL